MKTWISPASLGVSLVTTVGILIPWMVAQTFDESVAYAQVPVQHGKNYNVTARLVPARVNAYGQNCIVTVTNFAGEAVCTGYGQVNRDGGAFDGMTAANGICVCSSTAQSKRCVNTWYVRDNVPDTIWYRAGTAADGGVDIAIEVGGGCSAQ